MKALIVKNTTRISAEEIEVGMSLSINYTNVTVEDITPVGGYALSLSLREHFGGSTTAQVYLSETMRRVTSVVYPVYGPDVPVVDTREVYCSGCESAEYQSIKDEVLYEGGTHEEARTHLRKHVRLITCDSCNEEWERYNA